jgi:hypothetical protein
MRMARGSARGKRGKRMMDGDGRRGESGVGNEVGGQGVPVTAWCIGDEDMAILKGGVGGSNRGREEGQV